ncbi:fatty acid oxidation complex subunit alpha FadB [Pseudomaricurvus alkylphenolicus]|uniref:fatty acid oxidation complex subunit alpha FadB n=1 Tax=Pseudomaricurvus alkylphenolicus TaxID=1306991 RepID=UPI00141DB8D9|nr:fatty acid oxidation complex subunit alpha FadB [Pseudomaricurvus alkylphenolicus]NIB43859.1 fatty acid oxidation complex subunit alpha FadB [Pseudomaricurvus alkylphenolicus]
MIFEGKTLSVKMLDDGIAELNFDAQGESVNKFDSATVAELEQAIDALEQAEGLKGVLATSGKGVFIVGADISEFVPLFAAGGDSTGEHLGKNNVNNNRLEDLKVPVVVAINGFALGGGLEFCLACDYRIMSNVARVGLPEAKLGLIPGWGGTVRLPRLAGCDTAIEWIASGKDQKADAALKAGVVDGVVTPEALRDGALKVLQQCIDGKLDYASRRAQKKAPLQLNDIESLMAFETSKAFVAGQAGPNYPAPVTAVKCMQKAAGMERDGALEVEKEGFIKVANTDAAKALVGIFLSDQLVAKKAKGWEKQSDKKIERAAVLGAGIMGGGIAYQSALKGTPIKMKDIAQAGLDLGMNEANKLLSKLVARGRMNADKMGKILSSIEPTLSYENFDSVDMVVEAVVENPKVKHAVLADVEKQVSEDAIIASNTSTISITYLAEAMQRPQNFCGMHFFNPVHAMPLVEVIRGEKTSDTAVARTVAYANAMGKKAVVVNDCPGFLVNRVLFPYFAGFAGLVRDGADFQQIDKVMEKWGWPMGPAYLLDVVGIDTGSHAEEVMAEGFPDRMSKDFKTAADVMFENERYGQKNGKGFYSYEPDKRGKPKKTVTEETYDLIAPVCAERKDFDEEEIIARMMIPMATELARCLEENVVDSAAEADMALIYGIGFPPFRGGCFRWIDSIGIAKFVELCDKYQHLGGLYQATDKQREMAASGTGYYS